MPLQVTKITLEYDLDRRKHLPRRMRKFQLKIPKFYLELAGSLAADYRDETKDIPPSSKRPFLPKLQRQNAIIDKGIRELSQKGFLHP